MEEVLKSLRQQLMEPGLPSKEFQEILGRIKLVAEM